MDEFEAWTCETNRESHLGQGVDGEKLALLKQWCLEKWHVAQKKCLEKNLWFEGKFGDLSPQVQRYLVIWMVIRRVAFMTFASATLPVDCGRLSPSQRTGYVVTESNSGAESMYLHFSCFKHFHIPQNSQNLTAILCLLISQASPWHSSQKIFGPVQVLGTLSFIICKGEACNAPRPTCLCLGVLSFDLWNNTRLPNLHLTVKGSNEWFCSFRLQTHFQSHSIGQPTYL